MSGYTKAIASAIVAAWIVAAPQGAAADNPTPYPGTRVIKTSLSYKELVERLTKAIGKNRMGIVARASATIGAKSIGVTIPGNMVVMVYRPDFAVRMLRLSVPAGIEAPLRYYVTEDPNGKGTLTYRTPSTVFQPYENRLLDGMAAELDKIFANIVRDTLNR